MNRAEMEDRMRHVMWTWLMPGLLWLAVASGAYGLLTQDYRRVLAMVLPMAMILGLLHLRARLHARRDRDAGGLWCPYVSRDDEDGTTVLCEREGRHKVWHRGHSEGGGWTVWHYFKRSPIRRRIESQGPLHD